MWLVIALEVRAQSEFEWLDCKSHGPPLELDGSMGFKSLPNRSRKFLPLELDTWKVIFYWESMDLYSDFLWKSQEDLHVNNGVNTMFLVSLSTDWWRTHCCLLRQFQNLIQFWESLEKNSLSSIEIAAKWIWYGWVEELIIWSKAQSVKQ